MASISGANTILLKFDEDGQFLEGPLAAAAMPGENLVMTSAADTQGRDTYTPGATAAGGTAAGAAAGPVKILREDSLRGRTVNDAYAAGDNAFIYVAAEGDVLQVLVLTGQTIAKGNGGSAGADGKWVVATVNARGEFLEGSGGAALTVDTLMRMRIF
jgi:hypothetical protein